MNPQDFSWTEDQQVTVTNPTAEDYTFKVHNKEYVLGAGRTAKMPGYIAWVYVYGLSTQLAQADGTFNRWNEEGYRQTYYDKLVSGVDNLVQTIEIEPEPVIQTFDDVEEAEEANPPANTGTSYEPSTPPANTGSNYEPSRQPAQSENTVKPMKARRGRPARA